MTWPAEADKQGRSSSGLTRDMQTTASFLCRVGVFLCYLAAGECCDSWASRLEVLTGHEACSAV